MANHLDLEEQEQLDQLKHFWAKWGNLISAVLAAVMLALAAWNGYQYWQSRQAAQASALLDAIDAAVAGKDSDRIEQAFGDIRSKYSGTTQASQAGLAVAKAQEAAGKLDLAKQALEWVAANGSDAGYKALAQLRLSSVLAAQGAFDQALAQLTDALPPEFHAEAADRKGDIFVMQGKRDDAITQYQKAYQTFDAGTQYRGLVEAKLKAMGVSPQATQTATTKDAAK